MRGLKSKFHQKKLAGFGCSEAILIQPSKNIETEKVDQSGKLIPAQLTICCYRPRVDCTMRLTIRCKPFPLEFPRGEIPFPNRLFSSFCQKQKRDQTKNSGLALFRLVPTTNDEQ